MNDDQVVQKILKLLENNNSFIGYAINGGIGTKINVRNTETGKTIQALSINVDSTGEVLVVKDSEDEQYKAVTFKTAETVTERIIQLKKTKPVDDKKVIDYTDSDIEIFYLFVKLIDTGSPVLSQLTSTWIRKGSSCTQFVGAYERCNYKSKETINGVSYQGLPYKPYETLQACLNDDNGRDAKTPHGTKEENGGNLGWRYYSTKLSAAGEANMLAALESHDAEYNTNYKKLFGYGTILECSGAMYIEGWELSAKRDPITNEITKYFFRCDFNYLPGYTNSCTPEMQAAGYCDTRGFISSKAPLFGYEEPGMPSVGGIDNSYGFLYGWDQLPYTFMYRRHFIPLYVNGQGAPGSFLIFEGLNEDQNPTIPEGFFRWIPGCPSNNQGGPYDGSGGNRFPNGVQPIQKRDMKLSTHKAEIWLGSSKKEEAIKLYELGASDLFSGMYNALIMKADETRVDVENRLNRGPNFNPTLEENIIHEKYYENWNKNRLDLLIDPKVWVYIIDNIPRAGLMPFEGGYTNLIMNSSLQQAVMHLYNRTINLSIIDSKTQVIHLKLGLKPANILSNTDCKGGTDSGFGYSYPANPFYCGQSWEYQKYVTIKIKNWEIESSSNILDLIDIEDFWNKDYISRKFLTSFGSRAIFTGSAQSELINRNLPTRLLARPDSNVDLSNLLEGNNYEQWNYSVAKRLKEYYNTEYNPNFFIDSYNITNQSTFAERQQKVGLGTYSWWELWNKSYYSKENKRLNSIVGYEKNYYQIANSSKLGLGLNYLTSAAPYSFGNVITNVDYYEYLTDLPLKYLPSAINQIRRKLVNTGYLEQLKSREATLNKTGLNFFFSEWFPRWSQPYTLPFENDYPPASYSDSNGYYYLNYHLYASTTTYEYLFGLVKEGGGRLRNFRFDTLQWFNNLWAQFVFDEFIKVDIDSYNKIEFNLYSPLNKYLKYTISPSYTNSEYSFVDQQVPENINVDTVLSPGKLEIANKQVTIKKPTNVDLDPNMSFLLYLYPFVKVFKKTKEI